MSRRPLREIWRTACFDKEIRAKIALEMLCSWPAPYRREGDLGYWFFYYGAFGPPPATAFKLYPPSWIVLIAADGGIAEPKRIRPGDVGLAAPEAEPFASHSWPTHWSIEEADRKRDELLAAYDVVVAAWEARPKRDSPSDDKLAEDFRHRFMELTPTALLPCYRALGQGFFQWVDV